MAEQQRGIAYTLVKFSVPLILTGILQQLYNWVDAFVVGNVNGETALAAIGATTTLINLYLMVISGFTLGLTILFAQQYGSGKTDEIPQILRTFAVLLGAVFLVLAAVGMILTGPLLRMLNTTPDTIRMAEDYLRIIFISVPFIAVYNVYAAALRGIGDSRTPFRAILISSAVNLVLDILLVAVFRWGVAGAAAATVFAQAAMTLFVVIYSTKKYPMLHMPKGRAASGNKWYRQLFDRKILVQGARLGIPPMIQSSVSAMGSLILQNFMNGFGTLTVAAITTAYRVDSIMLLPIINFGAGISTIVAQCYGAGEMKQTKRAFGIGTAIVTVMSLLLTALIIPTGGYFIAMFGVSPQAVEIGQNFFRSIAGFYIFYGLASSLRGYLEGLGDVLYSSIAGIISLAVRIAGSYLMVSAFDNMVIAYAEGISWVILLMLYLIRMPVKWNRS